MSTVHKPYSVRHQTIDGVVIDREEGYPDLHLELHPVGTDLPEEKQSKELVLRIGEASRLITRINAQGIAALRAFLDG